MLQLERNTLIMADKLYGVGEASKHTNLSPQTIRNRAAMLSTSVLRVAGRRIFTDYQLREIVGMKQRFAPRGRMGAV